MKFLKTPILFALIFATLLATLLVIKVHENQYFPEKVNKPVKSKFWTWWKKMKSKPKKVIFKTPIPKPPYTQPSDTAIHRFHHTWHDFNNNQYEINWDVYKKDYRASLKNRASTPIYTNVIEHDMPALTSIVEEYNKIILDRNLDKFEALNMVVTSVQHIEYTLVHTGTHNMADWKSSYYRGYHKSHQHIHPLEQVGGCAPNVEPMAYFAPLEVAYHQMADCDSRTIFLFPILKQLGFDVIVISGPSSSNSYHSLLGVSILEGKGKYYGFKGKRYYLFETTYFNNGHFYPSSIGNFEPEIPYNQGQWDVDVY